MRNFFSAALAFASFAAAGEIEELTDIDGIDAKLEKHDYNVISWYTNDDYSKKVDERILGAKRLIEAQMESGEIPKRDIAWYRANIEEHPALDYLEIGQPEQIVINTVHPLTRYLHFHINEEQDEREAEEAEFVSLVRFLTGEYYEKIECDQLQADDRHHYDEVVFMGSENDLKDHYGATLELLSQSDRYLFDQQRIGFYWNDDPACKKQFDLEEDKRYLLMLNGLNSVESHIELSEDQYEIEDLMYIINTQVCRGTPRWGQRANSVVFSHNQPALVFMLEAGALANPETDGRDWRLALFAQIVEILQEKEDSIVTFVPILAHSDREDEGQLTYNWSLAEAMKIDDSDLPHIYMFEPTIMKAVPYPEKLDHVENFNPNVVLSWAENAKLETDLERLNLDMQELLAQEGEKDLDKADFEEYREFLQEQLLELELRQVDSKKELDTLKKSIDKKGNSFAEEYEDYQDAAELHVARIGLVMMEEL